jgi:hypothetical protein
MKKECVTVYSLGTKVHIDRVKTKKYEIVKYILSSSPLQYKLCMIKKIYIC